MLGDLLGSLPVKDIGATTIVVIVVLMILFDRLVTRRRLEEAREDGAGWKTAFEKQQEINAEFRVALSEQVSLSRSTDHALRSIQAMGAAAFAAASTPSDTQQEGRS